MGKVIVNWNIQLCNTETAVDEQYIRICILALFSKGLFQYNMFHTENCSLHALSVYVHTYMYSVYITAKNTH